MMSDSSHCSEPSCTDKSNRLFNCVHHCMKMVCLQHLTEHDRLIENNKRQIEAAQNELKRLYLIYSSFIDETKIRLEYEKKLDEYKRLICQVNSLLENNSNDVEQIRLFVENFKKIIQDKQKQAGESLTIVKVEAVDDVPSSSATTNEQKDESLFIGFDRLQNLIIDTDYHRRKAHENSLPKNEAEKKMVVATDDGNYHIEPNIHRIVGQCPLWLNGSYGLNQEHHLYRLCRRKRFIDLSNHIRQYHGLVSPIANLIARAVDSKVPITKCLVPNNVQVIDSRRSVLCPLRTNCQCQYYFPYASLRIHLIDVHHLSPPMAEIKVKKIQLLNKNKSISKVKKNVSELIQKIESTNQNQCKHITCHC